MSIHFGTSGWRAIIGDEFTFANLRRVSCAIARYIHSHRLRHKGLIVGYDTRFLSAEFAKISAETIAKNGIRVFLTNRDTPTPVIAYQIRKKKASGAINITASHNPPQYSGIKFSTADGGPASVEVTEEIENNLQKDIVSLPKKKAEISIFDPRPQYLKGLQRLVNFKAIKRAKLKVGVDLLYGTGRGYLDCLLEDAGCQVEVLHNQLDPFFGGLPPEPARPQLKELISLVRKKGLHLGLAVDADADRFGIIDRNGIYLNANYIISLLIEHLNATRPKQNSVARTLATTHMIDALAKRAGLKTIETPVGFKYIGRELLKGGCLIGGEESGGLSIVHHIPEKDGILACLLIAELIAVRKKSLSQFLKELYKKVGPFFNARVDFHLPRKQKKNFTQRIKKYARADYLFGKKIDNFNGSDGYKFVFSDYSWVMFRASGTEPVVRCYCEAKSKKQLEDLLTRAKELFNQRSKSRE